MKSQFKVQALSALLLVPSAFVNAQDTRKIEYEDLNEIAMLQDFVFKSPYAQLNSKISSEDVLLKLEDVRMWIEHNGERSNEIEVAADGSLILPVLPDNMADDAHLVVNQKQGTVALSINFGVATLPQKTVSYQDLFNLLNDTNTLMAEMGGAVAWFIPDMDTLIFEFEHPSTIEIAGKHYATNKENKIEIEVSSKLFKQNPEVNFSHIPNQISAE